MLEHYIDVVGVLDKGHGVDVGAFVVRENLRFEMSVEQGRYILAGHGMSFGGMIVTAEGGGEMGVVGGIAGDGEMGAGALAAPCHKLVGAGSHVEVHQVSIGTERRAALALLPHYGTRLRVDEIEGHGFDLRGECVGVEHVVVKHEPCFVVWVAVTFILIYHRVA